MRVSIINGLLASIVTLALAGCGKEAPPPPPPPEVGVITVKAESATLASERPGRVSAFETSEVRPQVNGIVRQRFFTEGAEVKRGQLLYQIDDAPYRAALGTAQGQLARARAAIDATALQSQRYTELVQINAVSRQDADNARATARQAAADVTAQRAALDAAKISLGYTQVRAPISGRIGRSLFTAGTLVQAGQADPLATIQRLDPVYVDVTQSAANLIDLRSAMAGGRVDGRGPDSARVRLTLPNGAEYPVDGRLQFADVSVDASTGSVTLRATFPNPRGILLPGMFVRARIVEGVVRDAILVPAAGVGRDEAGRPTVLIVDRADKIVQRVIQTSRLIGDKWLVTGGVAVGDRIVVTGGARVMPGSIVKPHPVSASAAAASPANG
ncbi:MAG: hemolysin [Rhizorhabdus sp.]|nr:hemolysin [Rhizorhabdus sp.]